MAERLQLRSAPQEKARFLPGSETEQPSQRPTEASGESPSGAFADHAPPGVSAERLVGHGDQTADQTRSAPGGTRPVPAVDEGATRSLQPVNGQTQTASELGRSRWEVPPGSADGAYRREVPRASRLPEGRQSSVRDQKANLRLSDSRPAPHKRAEGRATQASAFDSQLPDVPVLCYHLNLPEKNSYRGFNISPAALERQLRGLHDDGYRTIRLDQLEALVQGRRAPGLPEKPILITFDDGAISNLTVVEPLLRRLNFTAVLFFYPTILSSKKKNYLNWTQARRLAASDRFEIGSHTYWHPKLPELGPRALRMQLVKSKRVLEEKLGIPGRVTALAYPFGLYDERSIEQARSAGYRLAFTINPTRVAPGDNPYTLNRYMVAAGQSDRVFRKYIAMRSPRGIESSPPDGSTIHAGSSIGFELPGVRLDTVRVSINGRRTPLEQRGGARVTAQVPRLGKKRYVIVTVRARAENGTPVTKQLLFHNRRQAAASR